MHFINRKELASKRKTWRPGFHWLIRPSWVGVRRLNTAVKRGGNMWLGPDWGGAVDAAALKAYNSHLSQDILFFWFFSTIEKMEILSLQVVQNKAAGPGGGHGSIESLAHQDAERRDRAYQEQLSPGAHKSQESPSAPVSASLFS